VIQGLQVIDGADQGSFFPLPDEGVFLVGASDKHSDICLHDLYVKRVHCRLAVRGGKVVVSNLEDAAVTYINSQPVKEQELLPGDVLRVGNSHLRLQTREQSPGGEEGPPGAVANDPVEGPTPLPRLPPERLTELANHPFGHYRVGEVLGRGHSGVVFHAHDRKAERGVALKVLSPRFPANDAEMQRFARVCKTVLPLRHPHLVNLVGAGKTGPYCWVAREYVEGESLAGVLARGGKPNWKQALRVGVHVGRALTFIHRYQLHHGNITPANVLLSLSTKDRQAGSTKDRQAGSTKDRQAGSTEGRQASADKVVKLADWLLAMALEGSELHQGILETKLLAELPYLAPEQVTPNAFVDRLADIYNLGAVVYARLTGRPPFQGGSPEETLEQIHEAALVRPAQYHAGIPGAFEAAVVKMLARHQVDRYQTAAELVAELEGLAAEEMVAV
jgi:serine/threonine-protein kinase